MRNDNLESWPVWKDNATDDHVPAPHRSDVLTLLWLKLKRLGPTKPATPTTDQEGMIRYDRSGSVDGIAYLARMLSTGALEWKDIVSMLPLAGGSMTGNLTFESNKGIISRGTSPTIAAGAALGTGGSLGVAIEGTDRYGKIALTSGAVGLGTGVLARISFNTALADSNYAVYLQPADPDADNIPSYVDYTTLTATYWEISGTAIPVLNTSHHWFFSVVPYQP